MSQTNETSTADALPTCDDTREQAVNKIRAEFRRTLDAQYATDEGLRQARAQLKLLEARKLQLDQERETLLDQFNQLMGGGPYRA